MNKAFVTFEWKNDPDHSTPLNATNLNKINTALDTVDTRVVSLDSSKQDALTAGENIVISNNQISSPSETFTATYGETTYSAINTALTANKFVSLFVSSLAIHAQLAKEQFSPDEAYSFTAVYNRTLYTFTITDSDAWSTTTSNVSSVSASSSGTSTDTVYYLTIDGVEKKLPSGGGGGGTSNYAELSNKPKINNVELVGNKTTSDLGITIPTKTSDLTNDGDGTNPFLTQHQSLSAYRTSAAQDEIDATLQPKTDNSLSTTSKQVVGAINEVNSGKQSQHTTQAVTLAVADWSNKTQTVDVSGVTTSNTVIVSASPSSYDAYCEASIYCSAQLSGQLTFVCDETPTSAISVNVVIMGV